MKNSETIRKHESIGGIRKWIHSSLEASLYNFFITIMTGCKRTFIFYHHHWLCNHYHPHAAICCQFPFFVFFVVHVRFTSPKASFRCFSVSKSEFCAGSPIRRKTWKFGGPRWWVHSGKRREYEIWRRACMPKRVSDSTTIDSNTNKSLEHRTL